MQYFYTLNICSIFLRFRETSSIKVSDMSSQIASNIEASVLATNSLPSSSKFVTVHYNRKTPKRRRLMDESMLNSSKKTTFDIPDGSSFENIRVSREVSIESYVEKVDFLVKNSNNADEDFESLSNMVVALCEKHLFLLLLRAFEMFLPSCSLLPFIRSLQAFFQMRLSDASAHLLSFSAKIKDQSSRSNLIKDNLINVTWIRYTAVKAADAMLNVCPSSYEKSCLLKLLASVDFGDGGSASAHYRKLLLKIKLSEPLLGKDDYSLIDCENLDDASLLMVLEKNGRWEEARDWANELEISDTPWNLSVHHVTEMQVLYIFFNLVNSININQITKSRRCNIDVE
ncbi:hypothetical protein ZOSMA_56G00180 [Zostera marina]|uniref:Uncharacterized protein n=1 Tax=Zostera marina TaxID=29655 RepID=A0A0K9NXL4_ZOSMR|nr:hypothetical protein ZOSMA_56G00180 [Zostera marina]